LFAAFNSLVSCLSTKSFAGFVETTQESIAPSIAPEYNDQQFPPKASLFIYTIPCIRDADAAE
jgi:hypothetical protein